MHVDSPRLDRVRTVGSDAVEVDLVEPRRADLHEHVSLEAAVRHMPVREDVLGRTWGPTGSVVPFSRNSKRMA